jgi:small nuclear ribonucleoprotein (snRNP)-like protein
MSAPPVEAAKKMTGQRVTVLLSDGSAVTGKLAGVDTQLNVLLTEDVAERAAADPASAALGTAQARALRGDSILALGVAK